MKRFCIAIFILLSINAFSQTSFKMQIDTSIKFPLKPYFGSNELAKIIGCVDGGIAISGIQNSISVPGITDAASFILKTDSNGVLQWFNHYIDDWDLYNNTDIIQSFTGDFYLKTTPYDISYGMYTLPRIQKINNLGVVQSTFYFQSPGVAFEANGIRLNAIEKYNGNLHMTGSRYDIDASQNTCCFANYAFKCQSNLNIIKKIGWNYLLYDSLDVPFYADLKLDSNNQSFSAQLFDTSGASLSKHFFTYDSTQIEYYRTKQIIQDKDGYIMVHVCIKNNQFVSAIHKTDKNWNTLFFTVLDTVSLFPTGKHYINNIKIASNGEGGIFLTDFINYPDTLPPYSFLSPIMAELDSLGNVLSVWASPESGYVNCNIDTINRAALFVKLTEIGNYKATGEFQKEYFSSPSCGFISTLMKVYQVAISDSSELITSLPGTGYYPFMLPGLSSSIPLTTPTLTPICGVLSGYHEPGPKEICIPTIYPNPANDKIHISFDCDFSQMAEVKIFNIIGEEVFSKSISTTNYESMFDVSELPAGIYLVKSQSADQAVFNSKIVIQK